MATKKLKKKVQRKPAARKTENPVVDSARDIWLAGLGAFSLASYVTTYRPSGMSCPPVPTLRVSRHRPVWTASGIEP